MVNQGGPRGLRGLGLSATACILVLSGCLEPAADLLGGPSPLVPTDWAEKMFQFAEGHDHYDLAHHEGLSTPNFDVVGWTPLSTDYYGTPAGGYFCSDTRSRDGRALSAVHSYTSSVAMILTDVTNPAHPKKLGELVMENAHVYDLAMSPDQRSVVLTTDSGGGGGGFPLPATESFSAANPIRAYFRDSCSGETRPVPAPAPQDGLPFKNGLVLVDITNPLAPAITDYLPLQPFGHSVTMAEVDGVQLGVATPSFAIPGAYLFFGFVDTPAARRLQVYSTYTSSSAESGSAPVGFGLGGHDAVIQKHPITGATLAYLAYWTNNFEIVDITNPRTPTFVGAWGNWSEFGDGAPPNPRVHATLPIEGLWDDRHYTVLNDECEGPYPGTPTCVLALLDTTDPANPTFVGGWTLPPTDAFPWDCQECLHGEGRRFNLLWSLHYPAFVGRTLFISMYHGGLWAIDLSTPTNLRVMPTIGVYSPWVPEAIDHAVKHWEDWAPGIQDVNPLPDGKLVVHDANMGLFVIEFDATRPAPAPPPWPFPFNQ